MSGHYKNFNKKGNLETYFEVLYYQNYSHLLTKYYAL